MKVSIIMCAYNAAAFIEKAVESILGQTYTNWELIISDDASTDNTLAIVSRYLADPRIRLIQQPVNLGFLKNKNAAFSVAGGELVTQLDSDDTCPPDRLEKQVNVFASYPEIKICGGNFYLINLRDEPIQHTLQTYPTDFLIAEISESYPFVFAGIMFRKELMEEFGLLSEYFIGTHGEDHYWTARVNKKYPIYFLKDVIYHYRINPDSVTHVYNNPRKLIADEIIRKLIRQQKDTGTDWLETESAHLMKAYEAALFRNRKLMSEKYRVWAAKALDKKDKKEAAMLLKKAFFLYPANSTTYKTLLYYLKTKHKP